MRILMEQDRQLRQSQAQMVVVADDSGTAIAVISQTKEGIELITAADGPAFVTRVQLLSKRCPGVIEPPAETRTLKGK